MQSVTNTVPVSVSLTGATKTVAFMPGSVILYVKMVALGQWSPIAIHALCTLILLRSPIVVSVMSGGQDLTAHTTKVNVGQAV